MELKANQYFNNRYMLIQCMGEGASAQVWKAIDLQANNLPVALKIFSATGVMDTAGIQNFKHEFIIPIFCLFRMVFASQKLTSYSITYNFLGYAIW